MSDSRNQSQRLHFASLAAHQLKGPVTGAAMLLKTLLGEFVGPLNPQQKELLRKALERCEQALESVQRMMAVARASEVAPDETTATDAAALARRAHEQFFDQARHGDVDFVLDLKIEPAWVRGYEAALTEVISALINNALKYTPRHGRVRLRLAEMPEEKAVQISVADSGVGIPEADRVQIFEPFYRSTRVTGSTRPGVGLGLAFVKSAVEAAGGWVRAGASDLGGAEIVVSLPVCVHPELGHKGESAMSARQKVLIIGGAVAGPKAASKIIRLNPEAEVTVIERGQFLSIAGCGLPYYMSGVVKDEKQLLSTPAGMMRDSVFFQNVKNVQVMNQTEALAIDPATHSVRVRDCVSNRETGLTYDKLVLTTGTLPVAPTIAGVNLKNVVTLHGFISAERIKSLLARGRAHDVVIVGGGILGVEITECLVDRGCRVTILEKQPQLLRILDWEMAALVERYLESKGVRIMTHTQVEAFEGDGGVTHVVTDQGRMSADLVIMAIGFRPDVRLAQAAGLAIGQTGAIQVDAQMRTSDPDIYAAGDCVETPHLLTGKPCYMPYGSVATKQGRVAAINVCGGLERFPGVLGSAVCKVFDYCVAATGLGEKQARELGYEVTTVLVPAPDREHFMPNARYVLLKLVVDSRTRKLLGAQAVGPGMGEKRIDLAALAITAGMTLDQIANADLSYAPPYSPVMDNLITAANVARNKLDGHMVGITPMEVHRMLEAKEDFVFLDVRTPAECEQVRLPGSTLITLGALRSRLEELPKDKPIVTFCRISLRGYEAALILRAAGFKDVRVLDGGVEMWPFEKTG